MRNLAILLALLLIAVAAYYIYDNLRERTFAEKIGEIVHAEDQRVLSDGLKAYLQDGDPQVRGRAALAIGRIGAPGSGRLLLDVISSDTSMDVAARAAFAIGLTGEKEFASELLDLALDLPTKVAGPLVEAAGRLTDSSMTGEIDMIAGFLSHPAPQVRSIACMALFRANARAKGNQLADLARSEPDEEVQIAALYALARLGLKEPVDAYIKHFADSDPFARTLAVRGLGSSDTDEAIHYLTIALNDSDPRVVAQAVASLSRKTTADAKTKLAKKLSLERDEKLRTAIIDALARQNNEQGVDAVNAILSMSPPVNIVVSAVKCLATVQKDRAVALIDSLQTLDDPEIRAACAEAYAVIAADNIIPRLAVLFNDKSDLVRLTAFSSLLELDSTNADFYLNNALEDSSYIMTVVAVDHIAQKQLGSYLPRMRDMMSKGLDTHVDIRLAMVQAAGAFISDSTRDTLAVQIINDGVLDRDYIVRRTAAEIYEEKFDKDYYSAVPPAETRLGKGRIIRAVEKYRRNPYATITTNRGEIELELYFDVAPLTVLNFIDLSKGGVYEGVKFHRVIPDFVVQGGDPEGHGWGGPGYCVRCEYSDEPYKTGTVGIATSGKDTGGSQFFITHSPQPHLEGRYTVFGQVLVGMDVVNQIVKGDVIEKIEIHESAKQ